MRDGFAASVFGHAVILAWGLIAFHSPTPLDASSIESIPVDFVSEDATSAPKGVKTAAVAPKPEPEPVEKKVETPPPEPTPPPPPPPQPTPPPPEPTPPPPEPAPPPPPEPAPPPPPEPPKAAQAEPPPPELAPPPPAPTPEPAPPPPQPAPEAPPAPLPPVPQTATIQPKPDTVPLPKPRPRVQQPPTPQVAKKEPDKFDPDQITALLDKEKQPPQPRPPATQPPSQGSQTASIDAKMSANELDALRGRLAQCWSPPIGWTDPAEVRVIVIITLNPDGSLNGDPKVVQAPQGRYAQTAAESAVRAVRRCAPYVLPAEKYDSWKQVRVTFDPTEMGSG